MITIASEQRRAPEPPCTARVRLRARRRAGWLRSIWAADSHEDEQLLAITHSEVDRILADPADVAGAEAAFYARDPASRALDAAISAADDAWRRDPPWRALSGALELDDADLDLLCLAIAALVEPALERAYGYLLDDSQVAQASPSLAAALFSWPPGATAQPGAGLRRWALARPFDANVPDAAWGADPSLVPWLVHARSPATALPDGAMVLAGVRSAAPACLYPDELEELHAFVSAIAQSSRAAVRLDLDGPAGSGRTTLAAQLCGRLGVGMVRADVAALVRAAPDAPRDALVRVARIARVLGAALCWRADGELAPELADALDGHVRLTIVCGDALARGPLRAGTAHRTLTLPRLTPSARAALWTQVAGGDAPRALADWLLTPGEIAAAAVVAPAGDRALADWGRRLLTVGPTDLLNALPCPYEWDDIVLAPSIRRHLLELEAQVRSRFAVYEEWGLGHLVALGGGVSAMFAGPSGTGKTMAAQVLARSLGLELMRVDLAGVMNKYIGETEKRLRTLMDSCERANVLLFFDEADALFGKRTEVKDAHDRFANIEIDYLLQRMEQFDGVAILATNRKADLDSAFLRRLRFVIDFMPPGPVERRALWNRALPARAPDGRPLREDLDVDLLAERLEMSGADISSAALAAAFLARAAGTPITIDHVLHASRRTMAKHGVELRLEAWSR